MRSPTARSPVSGQHFDLWKQYDLPIRRSCPADTYEGIPATGHFYAGDPAGARDWVADHRDVGGINYVAIEFSFGDMTFDEARQSAELFATEVMPAFPALPGRPSPSCPGRRRRRGPASVGRRRTGRGLVRSGSEMRDRKGPLRDEVRGLPRRGVAELAADDGGDHFEAGDALLADGGGVF